MSNVMTLTPLFRHAVTLDQLGELAESALKKGKQTDSYPAYNIEKLSADEYRITIAIPGFSNEDLSIVTQNNILTIEGNITVHKDDEGIEYLHHGITTHAFERTFNLAEHVKVLDADLKGGILNIRLIREIPEGAKPRYIPINGNRKISKVIDSNVLPKKKTK